MPSLSLSGSGQPSPSSKPSRSSATFTALVVAIEHAVAVDVAAGGRVPRGEAEAEARRRHRGLGREGDRAAAGERERHVAAEEGRRRRREDPLRGDERGALGLIDRTRGRILRREVVEDERLAGRGEPSVLQDVERRAEGAAELRADTRVREARFPADTRARLEAGLEAAAAVRREDRGKPRDRPAARERLRVARGHGDLEAADDARSIGAARARSREDRRGEAEAHVTHGAARKLRVARRRHADARAVLVEGERQRGRDLEPIVHAERPQEGPVHGVVDDVDDGPVGIGGRDA